MDLNSQNVVQQQEITQIPRRTAQSATKMTEWSTDDNISFQVPSISTPTTLGSKKKKSFGLAKPNEFQTAADSSSGEARSVMPSRSRSSADVIASNMRSSANPMTFQPVYHHKESSSGKQILHAPTSPPSSRQGKNYVQRNTLNLETQYTSSRSTITPHKSVNEKGMRELKESKASPSIPSTVDATSTKRESKRSPSAVSTPVATPAKRKQPQRTSKMAARALTEFIACDEDGIPYPESPPPRKRQARSASKGTATTVGSSAMPIEVLDDDSDTAPEPSPFATQPTYTFPALPAAKEGQSHALTHSYFIGIDNSVVYIASEDVLPSVRWALHIGRVDFYVKKEEYTAVNFTDIVECISGTISAENDEYFVYLCASKVKMSSGEIIADATIVIVTNCADVMLMRHMLVESSCDKFSILPDGSSVDAYVSFYMGYRHTFKATMSSPPTGMTTRRRLRSRAAPQPQQIILVYPFEKDATDVITVYSGDLRRLQDNDFLNDNIIDFQVREIIKASPQAARIHAFSCLFYPKLTDTSMKHGDHTLVANWTKSIDIFSKSIVLVPINSGSHWSLVCLLNIGAETPPAILDGDEDDVRSSAALNSPCVLFMDSLRCHNGRKIFKVITEYLNKEWANKKKSERIFNKVPFIDISNKLPSQSNSYDCGVFIIKYVENIVRLFPSSTQEDIEEEFDGVFSKTLFTDDDVAAERISIRETLETLSEEYHNVMKERREKEKSEEIDETPAEVVDHTSAKPLKDGRESPALDSTDSEDECHHIQKISPDISILQRLNKLSTSVNSLGDNVTSVKEVEQEDVAIGQQDDIDSFNELFECVKRECEEEKNTHAGAQCSVVENIVNLSSMHPEIENIDSDAIDLTHMPKQHVFSEERMDDAWKQNGVSNHGLRYSGSSEKTSSKTEVHEVHSVDDDDSSKDSKFGSAYNDNIGAPPAKRRRLNSFPAVVAESGFPSKKTLKGGTNKGVSCNYSSSKQKRQEQISKRRNLLESVHNSVSIYGDYSDSCNCILDTIGYVSHPQGETEDCDYDRD